MSDLRQAAEQALQALEELQYVVVSTAKTDDVSLYYRAIAALSAALEKPTCKQSLQVAEQQASDQVADWHAEHLRAERLAEALEEVRSRSSIDLAMRSDQFELTARLGDIYQIAYAALAQEDRNG